VKPRPASITIGRVLRPQGRKGEVLTLPLSDRPERFPSLEKVHVETADGGLQELVVSDCWPHKGRFVLKFEGVDSIEAADKLRGRELLLAEDELEQLPPGSYYHHQLRGLRVQDEAGRVLGRVQDVLETGAVPVLQIADAERELLLPLAERFVLAVDVPGGTLTLAPEAVAEAAGR
jgi:16S rRNA processing protein RimM